MICIIIDTVIYMEILQLRYFCRAAETENFSAVAAEFNVPPSNISQSIKRLEKELGKPLFIRSSNRASLNPTGREFYKLTREALSLLDSAKASVSKTGDEIKISIRTNRRIVMQAIEKFRLEYPDVSIVTKHGSHDNNDDFDLIVSAEDMESFGFESTPILKEGILLAVTKGGKLDKKSSPTNEELSGQSFITMNEGTSMHSLTLRLGEKLGFVPHITLMSDDPFYIRRCCELGLGSVVIPSVSWRGQFSDDVTFRKIPGMQRTTYISQKKNTYLPESTKHFINLLAKECEKES